MTLWMAIDLKDKYKLPLYVCESPHEMAKRFNTTVINVWSSYSHYKQSGKERKFMKVEVEDED